MRAVINGLRYDTDKAVLIGEAGYSGSYSDFQWWEAGLYRTPRAGRYFPRRQWRPDDAMGEVDRLQRPDGLQRRFPDDARRGPGVGRTISDRRRGREGLRRGNPGRIGRRRWATTL